MFKTKQFFIALVAVIVIIVALTDICIMPVKAYDNNLPTKTVDGYPILYSTELSNIEYFDSNDRAELSYLIEICNENMEYAHNVAAEARALGYHEDSVVICLARGDYFRYLNLREQYQIKLDSIPVDPYAMQRAAYPVATQVWGYLKSCGYNDYVCAGIIGNMMAECGGHTLNLKWNVIGGGYYYGLCQWNKGYCGSVWGADVNGQLQYLVNTMPREFNVYGGNYSGGFNYTSFCNLYNERSAALAFAKCYERCGSGSYSARQNDATVALNYFT